MNSRLLGNVGLGVAIAWFTRQGYIVSVPLTDTQEYDLVVGNKKGLQRVSVKYTSRLSRRSRKKPYIVGLKTTGQNYRKVKEKPFDKDSCDLLFIHCDNGENYLIPSSEVKVKAEITLNESRERYRLRV